MDSFNPTESASEGGVASILREGHLTADRRAFIRRAIGLSLAIPAAGASLKVARAQDEDPEATPEDYVGSHGDTTGGTGSEAPKPQTIVPFKRYDPALAAVTAGEKNVEITVIDNIVQEIAKDVSYAGWSFDGTIPGPVHRVVEGDTVNVTFRIDPTATYHSLDLHSAKTSPDVNYKTIGPGEEHKYTFVPKYPGAYMYHCGTPPVLMHIGAGMYGAMIVDPKGGWPSAQELLFIQSEFYLGDAEDGSEAKVPNYTKMFAARDMDFTVFNGHASQYVDEPIMVKAGEPVRIFVVNAGPNHMLTFHVVGTIFDAAYFNANPANKVVGQQSISIGPGAGACVEFVLDEPGVYPAVNHAFGHAAHGAIALLKAE